MNRRDFIRKTFLAVAGAVAVTKFGEMALPEVPKGVYLRELYPHGMLWYSVGVSERVNPRGLQIPYVELPENRA